MCVCVWLSVCEFLCVYVFFATIKPVNLPNWEIISFLHVIPKINKKKKKIQAKTTKIDYVANA